MLLPILSHLTRNIRYMGTMQICVARMLKESGIFFAVGLDFVFRHYIYPLVQHTVALRSGHWLSPGPLCTWRCGWFNGVVWRGTSFLTYDTVPRIMGFSRSSTSWYRHCWGTLCILHRMLASILLLDLQTTTSLASGTVYWHHHIEGLADPRNPVSRDSRCIICTQFPLRYQVADSMDSIGGTSQPRSFCWMCWYLCSRRPIPM